jgi:CRISPR/Cas system-associated endoribonuclease Cas2
MLLTKDSMHGWLMIIYRVPSTPSTSRVTVWKKVKELGAFCMQQSVYVLPNLPSIKEEVNHLKEQIRHLGGESKIIEIASLGEDQEKEVIAGFKSNREEEYSEVIKAGKELLDEIDNENPNFASLEENEKHLQRIKELLDNVKKRDYFGSLLQNNAIELMEDCRSKLETFSHEVYNHESKELEDKKQLLEIGEKRKETHSVNKQVLAQKINETVSSLTSGVLNIENRTVGDLPPSVTLEYEFKEYKHERSLEIRIGWTHATTTKKK